ncbi:MAG: glycosyltransferase [Chitinivibrionales bacterium]|nr:glycosyltransferase [Chitinivibrionales bacterium]MBD3356772.1 glycosyltransferase [Chitinivibrionales bacterium]
MTCSVLHINLSPVWRGGEAQTLLLARGLHHRGFACRIAAPPDSPLAQHGTASGLKVFPLAPRGELDPFAALRLRRYLHTQNVRIVHAHTAHAHGTAALALLGLRSVPLVVTRRVQRGMSPGPLSRLKYEACGKIIAISDHIRRLLIEAGLPAERVVRIYSGIDTNKFKGSADRAGIRRRLGIAPGCMTVGTVAALTSEKGLPVLIDAAALVARRRPHVRFVVVGDGPLRGELQNRCRELGLDEHVLFTGFRSDIGGLLSAMDIFAFPSLSEGLGTSTMDAMLAGLPVVATRTGGIPEIVKHNESGYLFTRNDHRELARLLGELIDDRGKRRRFGNRGAELVQRFDITKTIEATRAVYDEILRTRGKKR